jgi:radical SAM protein with 4Fe4S-binding SPASM domain
MNDILEKNRINLISSYQSKSLIVKGFPVTLNIESTNLCNLNCTMCPRRFMTRKVGMMDFTLFKKIIDESCGFVELVRLHLFGEPLLHKGIVDMINYAENSGIRTVVSTNATMLDERISQEILVSELSFLVLSLDAAKKDTYEKVRASRDFDKVISNIEKFLVKVSEQKSLKIIVAIQMIRMLNNKREEELFIKRWLGKKNVHIFFKDFNDWAGQIEEISRLGQTSSLILDQNKSHCFNLWSSLSIYWDGTVVPCCYDYDGSYLLGNVNNQTLFSIWNNEKMEKIRNAHTCYAQNQIKLCSKCNIWRCKISPEESLSPFYQKNLVAKTFTTNITSEYVNLQNLSLIVNTEEHSLGQGWHDIENWPPIVRWTKKEAYIYFNIKKLSKLNIKMLSSYSDITELYICLNNNLFRKLLLKKSKWNLFRFDIPESEIGKKIEISIRLDKSWVPREILKTQDDRELGVAVSELWIE